MQHFSSNVNTPKSGSRTALLKESYSASKKLSSHEGTNLFDDILKLGLWVCLLEQFVKPVVRFLVKARIQMRVLKYPLLLIDYQLMTPSK